MFTTVELDPQRHHHPRDVATAEHDVAAGEGHQDVDRRVRPLGGLPYLALPCVGDPVHHGKGELLLAGEEVIQRPSGVSGFGCDLFEYEIAVPITRKPSGRRLEQCGSGARPALGLRPSVSLLGSDIDTCMYVC